MTTHTDNVLVSGWSGVGYIVINPETGDGGYYISGGENGGKMKPSLIAKLQFWIGTLNGFLNKYPVFKKALTGIIGLIVGKLTKLVALLGKCKSTSATLAIVGLFVVWNLAYLIVSLGLVAAGVGSFALMLLAGVEFALEYQFQQILEKVYCRVFINILSRNQYA